MGLNRHYCACGIHVHHGTRVIAAVFCLLQVVSIVNWGVQLQSESARGEPHVLPPPQPFYRLGHTRVRGPTPHTPVDQFVYSAIALGMTTIIHGMLLYGNLHRQPSFYWPFIIMNVIGCIGGFVVGFMLLLFGGASAAFISQLAPITPATTNGTNATTANPLGDLVPANLDGSHLIVAVLLLAVAIMCATVIQSYILSIVVRGFQFLREEHAPQWYGRLDEDVGGGRSSGQEGNPYVNVILKPQGRRGPADETEMLKH